MTMRPMEQTIVQLLVRGGPFRFERSRSHLSFGAPKVRIWHLVE